MSSEKEQEKKIGELEHRVLTLAMKLSQYDRLIAHVTYTQFEKDSRMTPEVRDSLESVILGKATVKEWRLVDGKPIEPILNKQDG